MKTYIIEEHATYYLQAESAEQAEEMFLEAIAINGRDIHCEVSEREIDEDPEDRMAVQS